MNPNDLKEAFERGLNQHGFAFQQRVIRETAQLKDKKSSKWDLLAVEQPVSVGDASTRIDFVLSYREDNSKLWLLVAECKRVNPAYGNWCFVKGAYHRPPWVGTQVIGEVLALDESPRAGAAGGSGSDRIFDIGFALKTDKTGDASPVANDKDALEQACQQVCRGMNGLMENLVNNPGLAATFKGVNRVTFVPVIFTTARLLTSDVDLRTTGLETGEVKLGAEASESAWVYFQYPQSPAIRHTLTDWNDENDSWSEIVAREFVRTIAIVSPKGISEFLTLKPPGSLADG